MPRSFARHVEWVVLPSARHPPKPDAADRSIPRIASSAPNSDGRTRRIRVSSSPSMCSLVTRSAAA